MNLPDWKVRQERLGPLGVQMPTAREAWASSPVNRFFQGSHMQEENPAETIGNYVATRNWDWPERRIYFFCDLHADAPAFIRSLVASGGIVKTGPEDGALELTEQGKDALFLVGGDCFDKGADNLRLLRTLKHLIDCGADVEILAGNHDIRTLIGILMMGVKEPRCAHMFTRMGGKTMPLFKEICDTYLRDWEPPADGPDDEELRQLFFPDERWFEGFPSLVAGLIPPDKLEKEMQRIREKVREIEGNCARLGLTFSMIYAAVLQARRLFLEPGGEFFWLFDRMNLANRFGSFLFIHAGVDDDVLDTLVSLDNQQMRRWFQRELEGNLFDLYHGSIGNCFRTKYRGYDKPLSRRGVARLHQSGIHAIVHGHLNLLCGQRMVFREGILNFECDASLDDNTRAKEGLKGPGYATTVFEPDGTCYGVSSDYPAVKWFEPPPS